MRKALSLFCTVLLVLGTCLIGISQADEGNVTTRLTAAKISAGSGTAFKSVASTNTDTASTETAKTADSTSTTIESVEATDEDGNKITVKLSDVKGLTSDWLKAAGYDADTDSVKVEKNDDGSIKTLSVYDADGNLVNKYDSDTRLMEYYHTSGDNKGKIDYITSESTRDYTWRDTSVEDPGKADDGHVVVQKYNYDSNGKVASVDYYTWTAGNRKKTTDAAKYSRYMYRQDTYENGELSDTKYFNDPRPTFWEPTLTGKVSKDDQGRIFLTTDDGKSYLLTARKDGFDADADGKVGADEMSAVDWDSYVGKEITVRGHQIAEENETDVYVNGEKAEAFGVVDVVLTDKGEKIADGWEDISEKVTEVMDEFFITVGNETDVDKVYDKIYAALAKDLKEAGITDANISSFADAAMKDKWTPSDSKVITDFSSYTDSASLIAKAWEYNDAKDYANARAFAQETITRYADKAKEQQASLTDYAASGKEADYWALNDVATAYYIMAKSYKTEDNKTKAKENYNIIINDYSYAQCWDAQGWWWKVKKAAQDDLDAMGTS